MNAPNPSPNPNPNPNPDQQGPPGDVSRLSVGRLVIVGLVVVIGLLAWRIGRGPAGVEAENAALREALANQQAEFDDLKKAQQLRIEEQELRRSDLQEALARADEATRAIAELERLALAWQREMEELLATDRGKPVAAHAGSLARLHALRAQERPDPDLAETLRRRMEPLSALLDQAVAAGDPSYAPSEDLVRRVEAVKAEATRAAAVYADQGRTLGAILATAPEPAAEGTSIPMLGDALEDLDRRHAAEEAEAVAEAAEAERRERLAKLAAEKAEGERRMTEQRLAAEREQRDVQLRIQEEEAARERVRQMDALAAATAQRKKDELEQRFQAALPEIQQLLMPFITEGSTQPQGGTFGRTTTRGRVSYSRLQSAGMLDDTTYAVTRLFNAVTVNDANDRPLGTFPGKESRSWQDGAGRAQKLLREFGPLLVEKGMLAE